MNNESTRDRARSRSRTPHRPALYSEGDIHERSRQQNLLTCQPHRLNPQSQSRALRPRLNLTEQLPVTVPWTSVVNPQEFSSIGRIVINLEDVKIPRRATEGLRPLFDRDELKESIRRRVLAEKEESSINLVQTIFAQPTTSTLDESHVHRRENESLRGVDPALQYRQSQSEAIFGSTLSSLSSAGVSGTSDGIHYRVAPDQQYHDNNRSPVSPHQRGPSPILEIVRENERRKARELQREREQRSTWRGGRSTSSHTPRPSIQETVTKTLHVTWIDNVIGDLKRSKPQLQHTNDVLRRHFQDLCEVPVLSVSYRPFSTWLMFKSVKHATEAMAQIRQRPLVFMHGYTDRFGQHVQELVRYEVGYSQSERWINQK